MLTCQFWDWSAKLEQVKGLFNESIPPFLQSLNHFAGSTVPLRWCTELDALLHCCFDLYVSVYLYCYGTRNTLPTAIPYATAVEFHHFWIMPKGCLLAVTFMWTATCTTAPGLPISNRCDWPNHILSPGCLLAYLAMDMKEWRAWPSALFCPFSISLPCRDILTLLGPRLVVGTVILFDELVNYEVLLLLRKPQFVLWIANVLIYLASGSCAQHCAIVLVAVLQAAWNQSYVGVVA